MTIQIMTLDPAHFHAALIHKQMFESIDPRIHVYAPLSPALVAYVGHMATFNSLDRDPTQWQLEVHAGPDFLARMLHEKPGNVVVLAGRNNAKIDSMIACVDAGLHVLADKPLIICHADFSKLQHLLESAARQKLTVSDMMTERFEFASRLQHRLMRNPAIFGALIPGTADQPAVKLASVHSLKKLVAGVPLRRSPEFFDHRIQGEALADVGTHLVDLSLWMLSDEALDYQTEIEMISARRWPTELARREFEKITGVSLTNNESIQYWCNNHVDFRARGHYVSVDARWQVESQGGDTHFAEVRGTRSVIRVSPDATRPGWLALDVLPLEKPASIRLALDEFAKSHDPELHLKEVDGLLRIEYADRLHSGHEAHFASVVQEFANRVQGLDAEPNELTRHLLAKYYVTTRGVEMAREMSDHSTA
jgi:predicted dehydrogenase